MIGEEELKAAREAKRSEKHCSLKQRPHPSPLEAEDTSREQDVSEAEEDQDTGR
jgi:hypothetical protein